MSGMTMNQLIEWNRRVQGYAPSQVTMTRSKVLLKLSTLPQDEQKRVIEELKARVEKGETISGRG